MFVVVVDRRCKNKLDANLHILRSRHSASSKFLARIYFFNRILFLFLLLCSNFDTLCCCLSLNYRFCFRIALHGHHGHRGQFAREHATAEGDSKRESASVNLTFAMEFRFDLRTVARRFAFFTDIKICLLDALFLS